MVESESNSALNAINLVVGEIFLTELIILGYASN